VNFINKSRNPEEWEAMEKELAKKRSEEDQFVRDVVPPPRQQDAHIETWRDHEKQVALEEAAKKSNLRRSKEYQEAQAARESEDEKRFGTTDKKEPVGNASQDEEDKARIEDAQGGYRREPSPSPSPVKLDPVVNEWVKFHLSITDGFTMFGKVIQDDRRAFQSQIDKIQSQLANGNR